MTKEQIIRLGGEQRKNIYNNICSTHNLVNIQQVKGKDLEIVETDKYDYILTYSFPCQDLSLAGKGKGMSDTSTRSGMLWEVERILKECKELGTLPQILLMENVTQVHGKKNIDDFQKWQDSLSEMGYKNYYKDLIATDYGIPQTRNRCFMVSILGDYSYTFPQPIPLKLKLKDMLEDQVDEKYFLSEKMIDFFIHNEEKQKEKGNGFRFNVSDGNVITKTITTLAGNRMDDNFIKIKNATKQGYLEATEGVIVEDKGNYYQWYKEGYLEHDTRAWKEDKVSETLCTRGGTKIAMNNLRIRKLTPKECFRLMGVKDEDFEKCAKNQSNASLYHLAGDSICTTVLMAIFSQLLNIEWRDKLWDIKNST